MLWRFRRELPAAVAILALWIALALTEPGFFTKENQVELLMANVPVLIVALGMTLVILTGQIDISVGAQFAIGSVAAGVFAKSGMPIPLACLAVCLLGGMLGAINGALVAYARIPAIVATLATMVALRDALRWMTEGAWIQDLPAAFKWFGMSQPAGRAFMIGVAVVLLAAIAWALRNLTGGRAVYAVGSNQDAARLAGIDAKLLIFSVFSILGALTGCAAYLNAARFEQIPSNAGIGLEMKAIASVVVGGAAITGGRGTVLGTVLGVILLGSIGPALTFLGITAQWERAFQGLIILAAVAVDAVRAPRGKYADAADASAA